MRPNFAQNLVIDTIHHLGFSGAKWSTLIDIAKAYYSVPLAEDCQNRCAFIAAAGMKSYVPTRLPMGLSISGSHYTAVLTRILDEIPNHKEFIFPIMDDLLIFSKTEAEHIDHIELVLRLLKKHGMKLNLKKYNFAKESYVYMGYVITYDSAGNPIVTMEKSKNEAIQKIPAPTTICKV